ncbi:SRPBCC family protein [Marinoscillum furvescens]|uniref:Uncharacterized protein YndB with AHSA1/START domain n=1 Tax=Marinoscillum furvescens DSM 4134 TaxID=1122208 RepID=A0A3D9LJ52_MARFU|nr:SRPBCC family protein [Marinoscillum furvescens]REE05686.1 uncharacterized protein YndB with AHSA1/START domain [Marinoscillum furvescens DSM 4134]
MITVQTSINAPIASVWEKWNSPEAIMQWNQASPDWHCPTAEVDLRVGGKYKSTMAAKDGSMQFDFEGTYTKVIPNELIEHTMADGRKVRVQFEKAGESTRIIEEFEPETSHPVDMQRDGWQAILDNFKKHVEAL